MTEKMELADSKAGLAEESSQMQFHEVEQLKTQVAELNKELQQASEKSGGSAASQSGR